MHVLDEPTDSRKGEDVISFIDGLGRAEVFRKERMGQAVTQCVELLNIIGDGLWNFRSGFDQAEFLGKA